MEKGKVLIEWPPRSGKMIEVFEGSAKAWVSETSRCRDRLKKYCIGDGIDIGYGGDAITKEAITIDLERPYGSPGWYVEYPDTQHLKGNGNDLKWFRDCVLDYVYSSHLLEDFDECEMLDVLVEWIRVLKIGGYLILYLPNQFRYKKYCREHHSEPNPNHRVKKFNLKYLKGLLLKLDMYNLVIEYKRDFCEDYSFEIVVQKL